MKVRDMSRKRVVVLVKILESFGLTLYVAGFTCLFLFCSINNGHSLYFSLLIVSLLLSSSGTLILTLSEKIRAAERRYAKAMVGVLKTF